MGGIVVHLVISVIYLNCGTAANKLWHSYQFGTGVGNREELIISDLKLNSHFNYGENVTKWKSISLDDKSYAIGYTASKPILVTAKLSKNNEFNFSSAIIDSDDNVNDALLMEQWNPNIEEYELILVIATESNFFTKLKWFQIGKENNTLLWTWKLHEKVLYLTHREIHGTTKLFTIAQHEDNSTFLNVFDFSLSSTKSDFWLSQRIQLEYPTKMVVFKTYNGNMFLSISQEQMDMILVFKYFEGHFVSYQNITQQNILSLTSFRIGSKAFLAIGASDSAIFRFTRNGLMREFIPGFNVEQIELWFPVPVKTYRDEVLIITQRHIYHSETHDSLAFEALVFNGRHFQFHDEMTCLYFGEELRGLSCLDEKGERGIFGAAVLSIGNKTGILIPKSTGPSEFFEIDMELKAVPSPVDIEVQKLKALREKLEKMISKSRQNVEQEDMQSLRKAKSRADTDDFETTDASNNHASGSTNVTQDNIKSEDLTVEGIKKKLNDASDMIQQIRDKLKDVIRKDQKEIRVRELIINGPIEVHGDTNARTVFVNKINNEPAHAAFNDIVSIENIGPITGPKTFKNVEVENITFNLVNNIEAKNIVFNDGGPLIVRGDITFKNAVIVRKNMHIITRKINDIILENEIVTANSTKNGTIKFKNLYANQLFTNTLNGKELKRVANANDTELNEEKLVAGNIHIKDNVTVQTVNGIDFNKFVQSLCFKNKVCRINGNVHIDGVVKVKDATIGTLNNLKFPEEYLCKNSRDFVTVTGSKTFLDTLTADEVNVNAKLNGIDPENILTRSTNQTLPGTFIFSNMKVLEKITVKGKIIEPHTGDLLTNPTLLEVNETKSNVNFKQLEVHGDIVILDTLNGKPFQDILGDVIYKDDNEADIAALKTFPEGFTVDRGLTVESNTINGIPLDTFVTKDTEQDLIFSTLNGDVAIENLLLTGFYGGLNITRMANEAVRLSGEQFVSGDLIFENEDPNFIDIASKEIQILDFLNGESIETLLKIEDGIVQSFDESTDIKADILEVQGSFESRKLNIDLDYLDKNRLSITRDQEINFPFTINTSHVVRIEADLINGIPYKKLFDPNHYINFITTELINGRLRIEEMEVDNLKVGSINDVNLNIFMVNHDFSFLNVSFGKNLLILGDVSMKKLTTKYFNTVPFELFARNIVYQDEEIVTITGFKNYLNGFRVIEKIYTDNINGIPIDDILTKNDLQNVASPVHIYGNVLVTTDCHIKDRLNNVSLEYLKAAFRRQNDVFIIRDNVSFQHETNIDNLYVDGPINQRNFEHITNNAGGTFENSNFFNNVTFKGTVHIRGNLTVSNTINGIILNDFLESIVFKNINSDINGLVIFKDSVNIAESLFSDQNLLSRYVNDIDLQKWQKEAVFINRGYIPDHIAFDEVFVRGDLTVKYLNDMNMKKVVLTKTDEDLNIDLDVGQGTFFNDVPVNGLVNGRNLQEINDSLLISGNQEIISPITFHGAITILGNLDIHKPVDGQNLNKVVTTNTEQNLTASYVFDNDVDVLKNLATSARINDIDFDEWRERSLKKYQNGTQNIYDEFVVKGEVNFNGDVDGTGLLGGLDIVKMSNELRQMKEDLTDKHLQIVDATRNVCKDVNYVLAAAKEQIYFFNYFEQLKGIILSAPIDTVHHFKHLNQNYLLINEINSCKSDMFKWEKSEFVYINTIETGTIEQTVSIYDQKFLLLVTNSKINSSCEKYGTIVWEFENESLLQLHTLPEHSQIQQSLRPRTFYGITIIESEVTEYYADGNESINIRRLTKWKGEWSQNARALKFVPRGLGTGLAVYDHKTLYRLLKVNKPRDEFYDYNYETIEIGTILTQENCCFPPLNENSDMETIHAGHGDSKRTMVAIASHEETSIKGKWDNIKIYENILNGKVFHKISTYKPSSLVNIEFGNNGESLLVFLENQEVLQVYEYKGIEGFQNRLSKQIRGRHLLHFSIQESEDVERKLLLVVGYKRVHVLEAITEGNQLRDPYIEC